MFINVNYIRLDQDPVCLEPFAVVGPCKARFPKYSYDASVNECKLFYYGNCNGNNNQFNDKASCETACLV